MSTLYIHIGYHKTGTTAIQNYLWKHRARLKKRGVLYPAVALSGPTHAKLANVFKGQKFHDVIAQMRGDVGPGDADPYELAPGEDAESLYSELHKAIDRGKCPTTVISSECFLEWIDPAEVARYVSRLGMDIKIVIYLRRQDLWIESVYNQIIKDRYLRYSGDFSSMPQHEQMNYLAVLDDWAAHFGVENLVVRAYEGGQLKNGNVIDDFLSILGIDERFDSAKSSARRDNASLHKDVVKVLIETNALQLCELEHALVLESLDEVNSTLLERDGGEAAKILSDAKRKDILKRYAEVNRTVAMRYMKRDDGVLFYDTPQIVNN